MKVPPWNKRAHSRFSGCGTAVSEPKACPLCPGEAADPAEPAEAAEPPARPAPGYVFRSLFITKHYIAKDSANQLIK